MPYTSGRLAIVRAGSSELRNNHTGTKDIERECNSSHNDVL